MRFSTSAALLALAASVVEPRALQFGSHEESALSLFKRVAVPPALPPATPPKPPPTVPKTPPRGPGGKGPGGRPGRKPTPKLCRRAGPPCGEDGEPLPWYDPKGKFIKVADMKPEIRTQFWEYNSKKGDQLMTDIKNQKGSRADQGKGVPKFDGEIYKSDVDPEGEADVEDFKGEVSERYEEAGVKGVKIDKFTGTTVWSRWASRKSPILEMFTNKESKSMVMKQRYANRDPLNPAEMKDRPNLPMFKKKNDAQDAAADKYLRVSELAWQKGWKEVMDEGHTGDGPLPSRGLESAEFNKVHNGETEALVQLAHEKFPKNVDSDGKGTWKPGDEGFKELSNSPNIKNMWNMVLDHKDDLDNPYITEINTFPNKNNAVVLKFSNKWDL